MKKHALERGQTLPFLAVAVLLLVAMAGFAADVGYHQYQQRIQQTATDSAAMAAASELANGNWQQAGQRDAASNGFTDGVNRVRVSIVPPAAPDPYASNPSAVEADITATYSTFFERVFNIQSVDVSTKAVAIANSPSNWCMVALDTNGTTNIDAHSTINAPNCDIAVNNAHLSIGGQSTITTSDPIQYSGSLTGSGTATFAPGMPVQALPASDPCPQIASCLYLQRNPPSTATCTDFVWSPTISPGTYCSMKFNGDTTLSSGTYVVTGGFNASNATLTGGGVTIVFTSSNGQFSANNTVFQLSAPTSGPLAGMLWYAPDYKQPIAFNSGEGGLQGVIYFPKANLTLNAGTTAQMLVIAGQLSLNAANTSFQPLTSVQITHPRLVE